MKTGTIKNCPGCGEKIEWVNNDKIKKDQK